MKKNKIVKKIISNKLYFNIFIIIIGLIIIAGINFIMCNYRIMKNNIVGNYDVTSNAVISNDDENNLKYNIYNSSNYIKNIIIEYESNDSFNTNLNFLQKDKYGNLYNNVVDKNSFYGIKGISYYVNAYVENIEITIPNNVEISKIYIDNSYTFNIFIFMILSLTYIIIFLTIYYKKEIVSKLHIFFFIISFFFGSTFIIFLPAVTGISWDDQIHYSNIINLLNSNKYEKSDSDISLENINIYFYQGNSKYNRKLIDNYLNENDKNTSIFYNEKTIGFNFISYFPGWLSYKICNLLNIKFSLKIRIMKFTCLILYSLIISFAIKNVKKYKSLFFTVGLIPVSVFLASNFSYDTSINCLLLLAFSYLINIFNSKKISNKDVMICIISMVAGSITKAIYIPLILLLLLIDKDKFENEKQCKKFKLCVLVICALTMVTFILPTILNPGTGDARGGSTVNTTEQIKLILRQPISFAKVFISNISSGTLSFLFSDGTLLFFAYLSGSINFNLYLILIVCFALTYIISSSEYNKEMNIYKKLFAIALILIIICEIYGAMYLSFCGVGTESINGVQGRYFIPLIFPLLYTLMSSKIRINGNVNSLYIVLIILITIVFDYSLMYNIFVFTV